MFQQFPGNADLYVKINDDDTKMSVDMVSHPVKVAVGNELLSFLDGIDEVEYSLN